MTASDWTCYPVASMNRKDFYNLMGIYLDAVFFPLLREQDFRQEGHRLEFADQPLGIAIHRRIETLRHRCAESGR
jgi:Zn-dependent M16 (insulinase) family peptidase